MIVLSFDHKVFFFIFKLLSGWHPREAICCLSNVVPWTHVSFGQHQETELWDNQFPESKILGVSVSRRMRALIYMAPSRDRVDVDAFHKGIQYALEKLGKSKFGSIQF